VAALIPAEEDPLEAALSTEGLPEQVRVRREKLERIREMGINPYPVNVPYDTALADVRAQFPDLAPDTRTGTTIMELLAAMNRGGKTIIMVTHDQRVAGYARRRIELVDGRLA
jgi:lysyl-tRNA synthetase class II